MNLSFKICELDNLDTLIKISKETFVTAFKENNNPEDFDTYINEAFNLERIKYELLNPNSTFYFTYLEDNLVGYFKLNINDAQNEQFEARSMELERIYVLNAFQGQQIGKQMLEKTIELAKSKGMSFLWLGVWQENTNAVRFYERYHFKVFGEHPYYIGKDKQIDWLMKLDLI
jgi:ribosomal protein S18 acetylase RimI-like enzyme